LILTLRAVVRPSRRPTPHLFLLYSPPDLRHLHSFPTRRSSDLSERIERALIVLAQDHIDRGRLAHARHHVIGKGRGERIAALVRSEEHTSELQSRVDLVCRLLLEKKNTKKSKTQE